MSSVAEKYARSLNSSHLQMRHTDLVPGAIDVLTAAGMLPDSLGVSLLRLRAEFDSIRTMPGSRTMLPRLKSAGSVRTRLLAMVLERGGVMGQPAIDLVAKLLDQWCDPSCPVCTGRGTMGSYGEPQSICKPPKDGGCGGSKRRTLFWAVHEQSFADAIEGEMLAKVDAAERRIRRLLMD